MRIRLATLIITTLLSGCGMHIEKKPGGATATQGGAPVSFSFIKSNILDAKCVGCHSAGNKAGDLPFTSHADLMRTGTVKAGNAAGSAFYQAIDSAQMPPRQPRLADELVQAVSAWIDQGAVNN